MNRAGAAFSHEFAALVGRKPFCWQTRLFKHLVDGSVPAALDLPTGLGKTSVMAIWLIARAHGAKLPRRLVYVVDRRAVVDQATDEASKIRDALEGTAAHFEKLDETARVKAKQIAAELKIRLSLDNKRALPISTLRGAHVDNREWLDDPAGPAIIVGTVDMIGSRLLFEGYGVSRKMRPYQAGLLGTDALVVLDEAHLVPPFAHLLRAIEQDTSLRPRREADRAFLPGFVLLPLSATQRRVEALPGRDLFCLQEEDAQFDAVVCKRLSARKRLRLYDLGRRKPEDALADEAWKLSDEGRLSIRCIVYCDSREVAEKIGQAIKKKAGRKKGDPLADAELFVGARRVHEREAAAQWLKDHGFIGDKGVLKRPTFLIATSAGEVGVDIDADHMVSDLVAWERMVQRLGRVNRRGEGDAEIRVFWSAPSPPKNTDAPTETEAGAGVAFAAKAVIERLPQTDGAFDTSPGALRRLNGDAQCDAPLKALIENATTPEPLRPALIRALVDAWSMTSLEIHTGRPEVAPWLRGWVEETPQTTIAWRTHLPVRVDDRGRALPPDKTEIGEFFEAAPPHQSEKLETETYRVADWLQKRAEALFERKQPSRKQDVEGEAADGEAQAEDNLDAAEIESEQGVPQSGKLQRDDIVALILSPGNAYTDRSTLRDLAQERKGDAKKEFEKKITGKILVVDARFGGLKDGLLDADSDFLPETADTSAAWSEQAQFRVTEKSNLDVEALAEERAEGWRFEDDFVLRRDGEGSPLEWLTVEHFRDAAQREDARAISKPQELTVHQDWARNEMLRIAEHVGLSDIATNALAIGAGLHDEGKRAPRWQRAFRAPRIKEAKGKYKIFAKTRGPIDQAILGGYRHEFGSLSYVEESAEFRALPEDWRDLVLHLVAAHHGQARPVIETRGCEDPPSLLEARARAVALRFARLQKQWGPWGLAWWEALLRAADQRASRRLEDES